MLFVTKINFYSQLIQKFLSPFLPVLEIYLYYVMDVAPARI